MSKLLVKINQEFEVGPFLYNNDASETVPLKPDELRKKLKDAVESDFCISVTFFYPDTGTPSINFDLPKKGLKKGAVFEWQISESEGKAKIRISGELASGPLRSGVVPKLESEYVGANLYLDAFNFKGGEWSGFRAPLIEQNDKNYNDWKTVDSWMVK